MRSPIAGQYFYFQPGDVEAAMKGIEPETGGSTYVTIGRLDYPIKQVGAVITGQDRRDFTTLDIQRALTKLGFTCRSRPPVG